MNSVINLAHDLSNKLAIAKASLDLMEIPLGGITHDLCAKIQKALNEAMELTNKIRNEVKKEEYKSL